MKEGWEFKKLGEVVRIINGYAFKSSLYEDEGIRVMRITNVQKGQIVDDDPKYYPIDMADEIKKYLLKEKDLLMSLTGNVGRVGLLCAEMLPAALNQRVACLRIQVPELLLEFLFHLLNSDRFEQEAIISAKGIAQKNMSTEWLKDYLIPLPPLSQQQSIVAELDKINEIIDLKKAQLKDLDLLAQSIFYDMFGDPIENPKGWEVKKLGEVCEKITDGDHMPPPKTETGIPFITISNVDKDNRDIDFKGCFFVPIEYYQSIKDDRKPKVGDVLYTVTGSYGIPVLIKKQKDFCFQRHIGLLRPSESLNSVFLTYWALSPSTKRQADDVATGIAQKTVSLKGLRNFQIPLPPLSLQQSFASKIQAIESQKSAIKQSLAEMETLLASRMDYWFG